MTDLITILRLAVPLTIVTALCAACGQNTAQPAASSPGQSIAIVAGPTPSGIPPASEQARYAASRFAGAWVRTDLDLATWRTNLTKHATTEFAERIATLTPGDQPAQRLIGPLTIAESREREVTYTVPTDAGILHMTAVPIDYRWRIASAEHVS